MIRNSEWDRYGVIGTLLDSVPLPKMSTVSQHFEDNSLRDVSGVLKRELAKPEIKSLIKPGMTVALTGGSRGIADISVILKETIAFLKNSGANPFIFPAMGSHGGATAEGQTKVLESYGITEQAMGVPIKSSMETVLIGRSPEGRPVHIDKNAYEADAILVVGRVKPHTQFHGKFESGLLKMMVIGMGKALGADSCHSEGFPRMAANVETYAGVILQNANILFGLALVENSFDRLCHIEAVLPAHFKEREEKLLVRAKELMPKIYIPRFDILIVDQIGKNFSGDGADPNIIGYHNPYREEAIEYTRCLMLDISEESHGNAVGIGTADISTKRVFDKMDFDATYPNLLVSNGPEASRIPMILKNDKLAIQAAIFTAAGIDKTRPKIVRIKNSSRLEEIQVSEALLDDVRACPEMKILSEPKELPFDEKGNLPIGVF
jgi:hypothetical protein